MRFLEFEIIDFGIYAGTTMFELAGRRGAHGVPPIVLIGGKNGAGKTTFLEALRLCLYGALSFPGGIAKREYRDYLRSRIHRTQGEDPALGASLALTFQHAEAAELVEYRLVRRWWLSEADGQLSQRFEVYRGGVLMEDLASEHWTDFIEDLIPVGVSRLFFFDGEQIQGLADDETADADLARSLKTMLGLDLVERLRADLSHYQLRELKKASGDGDLRALEEAEVARLAAQAEFEAKSRVSEEKDIQLAFERSALAGAEKELRARGGNFAAARERLFVKRGAFEAQEEILSAEARKLLEGPFAVAFCPRLLRGAVGKFESEEQTRTNRLLGGRLRTIAEIVRGKLKSSEMELFRGSSEHAEEIAHFVAGEIVAAAGSDESMNEPIHDLSSSELHQFVRWIEDGAASAARGRELAEGLRSTTRSQVEVERHLKMAPDDDALSRSFETVVGGRTRVLGLEQELADLQIEERAATTALTKAQRDYEKLTLKLQDRGKVRDRIRMAKRSTEALTEYQRLLTSKKVEALETRLQARFAALARKEDLVRKVSIDPKTFQVHLYDSAGGKIPRRDLSAGEKQIYAIAMLWGLADVSGRPLPMIVDTPLGRLDSDHRKNLIEHYFPKVSHQVVILSTDTEVDQQLFQAMEPDISHAYLLEAKEGGRATQLTEGYFWKGGAA